ncbi:MAG: class I SAM-dependent methyltransferase [Candidatus Sulfotelmatobacter sp.]|jgi:SAM-dependent methyltransferase
MDPKYGERYRDLFERHWWWRARTRLIVDVLRRLQPQQGWKNILDIGCGDGLFFPELSQFGEVEGVEPFGELVNPHNPYREHIQICPFDESFQPGKRYSLILMLDVLEHLENAVGALRHALNLLEPDGMFIATVPAFMALWTNHDVLNHHFLRYTKSSFRQVAQKAGLRIQEQRYLYHWTCPVKLAIGMRERLFHSQPKPAQVPPWAVNELLFWTSRIEQKTLSVLSLPFGSSLMVVGVRDRD